jgi:hypothetical protein
MSFCTIHRSTACMSSLGEMENLLWYSAGGTNSSRTVYLGKKGQGEAKEGGKKVMEN